MAYIAILSKHQYMLKLLQCPPPIYDPLFKFPIVLARDIVVCHHRNTEFRLAVLGAELLHKHQLVTWLQSNLLYTYLIVSHPPLFQQGHCFVTPQPVKPQNPALSMVDCLLLLGQ